MPDNTAVCIYCSQTFNNQSGEGDHVLPRGFGDFDGGIIYRGVCPECNNKLSPLEEELLRTAPEAVLRRFAGATQNRRGEPTGWQAASGSPSPRFFIKHSDHDELIEADPAIPGQAEPIDQLTVVLKDSRSFSIRLFPLMTADAVRRKFRQLEIAEAEIAHSHWHADESNAERVQALVKELWPACQHTELPSTPAGLHRVPIRIEFRITQKYYRAIAKIAFHYFLANTRCGFTGHEECFESIRKFIMEGGDQTTIFDTQKLNISCPFGIISDGTALLPARWTHLLICAESAASVIVAVYTVFGPIKPPSPHFVTLLDRRSPIILKSHQYGHAYIHGNAELGDTRSEFVVPVDVGVIR